MRMGGRSTDTHEVNLVYYRTLFRRLCLPVSHYDVHLLHYRQDSEYLHCLRKSHVPDDVLYSFQCDIPILCPTIIFLCATGRVG